MDDTKEVSRVLICKICARKYEILEPVSHVGGAGKYQCLCKDKGRVKYIGSYHMHDEKGYKIKVCSKCNKSKRLSEYRFTTKLRLNRSADCNTCHNDQQRVRKMRMNSKQRSILN